MRWPRFLTVRRSPNSTTEADETWIVLWENPRTGKKCVRVYQSQAEARDELRFFTRNYPWVTHYLARVMETHEATEEWRGE